MRISMKTLRTLLSEGMSPAEADARLLDELEACLEKLNLIDADNEIDGLHDVVSDLEAVTQDYAELYRDQQQRKTYNAYDDHRIGGRRAPPDF